jgi:aryl-alcohol dehydrogenase-like predicted oxidoreductase
MTTMPRISSTPVEAHMSPRTLGRTDISLSAVSMGCWPIAGMTSLGVTEADSMAALQACLDCGITTFDTAYCYGLNGESERLIAKALGRRRDEIVICTKGGIHFDADGKQVRDARPATLRRECEESLRRLNTDRVELLYLHAPDPATPVEESAGELRRLMEEGKTRAVGVSNVNVAQLEAFSKVCPIAAYQPPYNMLLRDIEADTLPWCIRHGVSVLVYWPLMKGLLAGGLPRDFKFQPKDGRAKYPMFQGDEWQRNQDLLDALRPIAAEAGRSLSQLVINWTIHQPGITSAICGAKRADQVRDNAGGMGWRLSAEQMARIEAALEARGKAMTRWAM